VKQIILFVLTPSIIAITAASAGAAPIYTNSGNVSVTCVIEGSGLGQAGPTLTAVGPHAAVSCPVPPYGPGFGQVNANGLMIRGGATEGFSASFAADGQMQDTITNTGSTGQGVEQFDISFQWTIVGFGAAEVSEQAGVLYNGTPIWNGAESAVGEMARPDTGNRTATIRETFTYGQPFSVKAGIQLTGDVGPPTCCGDSIDSIGALQISWADITQDVPEPSTWELAVLVIFGFICLRNRSSLHVTTRPLWREIVRSLRACHYVQTKN
jgi:hypothetical protein